MKRALEKTEEAVETADGLVAMLAYVHDVAPAADHTILHTPIGYTLNAIKHELQRAREGYETLYRIRFEQRREQPENEKVSRET